MKQLVNLFQVFIVVYWITGLVKYLVFGSESLLYVLLSGGLAATLCLFLWSAKKQISRNT